MLGKLGYEVAVANDGKEAIEMCPQVHESEKSFDIVILDLTVPGGMGGKEAIQILKELYPNVTALVFSGYSNDPIMSNFRDYGFKGVVKKPCRIQDMSDALRSVSATDSDWDHNRNRLSMRSRPRAADKIHYPHRSHEKSSKSSAWRLSQISDHQQSMVSSRPSRGIFLIPPALLLVAD